MILNKGVFYRKYGDVVYCRYTDKRKDYLFNATAYDFFDFIREHPGCSFKELCDAFSELYVFDSQDEFLQGLEEFCTVVESEGLVNFKMSEPDINEEIRNEASAHAKESKCLFTAVLELTYRCNARCIHCYVDDAPEIENELSLEEYRVIIDQLYGMGCINILFTGGEVSLRKDFLDIVEYAEQKGFCVDIYSNGLQLTLDMVLRLASLHVNSVSFSLYSADQDTHDIITRVPGSFRKTLESIMLCKAFGIDTYIKTVVMKQNYQGIDNLFMFGKKIGVPVVVSTVISASHNGKSADEFRLFDEQQYRHVSELVLETAGDVEKRIIIEGNEASICGIGRNTLSIDPFGNVFPCNALHVNFGNVRTKTIADILSETTFYDELDKKSFLDICEKSGSCEHSKWCSVCVGASFAENGTWHPIEGTCLAAKALHELCINKRIANQNL